MERTPVDTESWAKLNAVVGARYLYRCSARVVNELLCGRVVTRSAMMEMLSQLLPPSTLTYTLRVAPLITAPLSTCQHRWFPCGEIHVMGLPLSFCRVLGEASVEEVKHVKRATASLLTSMA